MARQKRTRGRTTKQFGKLPYSELAGNAQAFVNDVGPRFQERVLQLRREKGQALDSCEGVW